eukprot:gb/GFBE01022510.1/.p1 GENE.gb/GFBE01022510.1/~~gb/GFBE01022510.1/.p1  ORF type:complete len:582 (+),score=86.85 gb/GFBE01022510.1/:1-1746(+)
MLAGAAPVGIAVAVCLGTLHVTQDWKFILYALRRVCELCVPTFAQGRDADEKVKTAIQAAHLRNAIAGVRSLSVILLGTMIISAASGLCLPDRAHDVAPLWWTALGGYTLLLPLALGKVNVTLFRIKVATCLVQMVLNMKTIWAPAEEHVFLSVAGAGIFLRMALGFTILDGGVNTANNVITTLVNVYKLHAASANLCQTHGAAHVWHNILLEIGILLGILFVCSNAERMFGDNVAHVCKIKESKEISHRYAQGSRRLLSIFCDATVDLDGELKISGPCPSLAGMMMTGSGGNLVGKDFSDFVVEADKQRFHQFLTCSTAPSQLDGTSISVPSTVQLRLEGAFGLEFEADVFHVHMGGSVRAGRHHHVIGVRAQEHIKTPACAELLAAPALSDIGTGSAQASESCPTSVFLPTPALTFWDIGFAEAESSENHMTSVSGHLEDSDATDGDDGADPMFLADLDLDSIQRISLVVDASHPELPVHKASLTYETSCLPLRLDGAIQGDAKHRLKAAVIRTAVSMQCRSAAPTTVVEDMDILVTAEESCLATAQVHALPCQVDQREDACLVGIDLVLRERQQSQVC